MEEIQRKKAVKLEDIAKRLNISVVSASNALKGKKGVSEELRKKVLDVAEELGYRPLSVDTQTKGGKKIGVLILKSYVMERPSLYMDIYQKIVMEMTKKNGFVLLEVLGIEKEKNCLPPKLVSDSSIEGIIVLGEIKDPYTARMKLWSDVPIIFVDYYKDIDNTDFIVTDGYRGMYCLTKLLLEKGMKEVMFVGTPLVTNSIMDRFVGYRRALMEYNIPYSKDLLLEDRDINNYEIHFTVPKHLPEAFVCNCDKTANILVSQLKERKIAVPKDISVVGFDGFDIGNMGKTELTTYEIDRKSIAQVSVKLLLKRMNGSKTKYGIRTIEGKIKQGNSVKE